MKTAERIDPRFFCFVAQMAHWLFGAFLILAPWTVLHSDRAMWWTIGVATPLAAIKEGWYDPKYENATTAGSGWLDFSSYMVGLGIGVALVMLSLHGI